MTDSTSEAMAVPHAGHEMDREISPGVVLTAMGAGLAGMVAMLPILVGIPAAFNLFRTEPIADFAPFLEQIGVEPSLTLGVALFVVGGTTILPLMFVVVGMFLPPERPRYLSGVSFATIFWTGFILAFWPGGDGATITVFLVVSLLAHWVYGGVLGLIVERTVGIPEHDV